MALKKTNYGFDLLESFSNGTPELDSSWDFQGLSYSKISLFLLTAPQTVIFFF